MDDQRRKSVFTQGSATTTRYYLGGYEEVYKPDGTIQKIHYLARFDDVATRRHQVLVLRISRLPGFFDSMTNQSGTVVERRTYDPGVATATKTGQRSTTHPPSSTTAATPATNTGRLPNHQHERPVYDPLTAQFFSPDPFVQAPTIG